MFRTQGDLCQLLSYSHVYTHTHTCGPQLYTFRHAVSVQSMYYTAVILGGEWAKVDFSIPGKIVCCFAAVFGVALFSIPMGFLFDAFSEVLGDDGGDDDDDTTTTVDDAGDHSVMPAARDTVAVQRA